MKIWAMRTDRNQRDLIMQELRAGRLRQGWGYAAEQDLGQVLADGGSNFENWERLTPKQQETVRHSVMWGGRPGDMQTGDIVLVPNLPELGSFSLCEITGGYRFEILQFSGGADYGHIREAKLIEGCEGISNDSKIVGEGIRRTLRCRSRLWRLDKLDAEIRSVREATASGQSFDDREGFSTRFKSPSNIKLLSGRAFAA